MLEKIRKLNLIERQDFSGKVQISAEIAFVTGDCHFIIRLLITLFTTLGRVNKSFSSVFLLSADFLVSSSFIDELFVLLTSIITGFRTSFVFLAAL